MKILCNTKTNNSFLEFHFNIFLYDEAKEVAASNIINTMPEIIKQEYDKFVSKVILCIESLGFTVIDVGKDYSKTSYDTRTYRSDYFKFYSNKGGSEYPVLIDLRLSDHDRDDDDIKRDSDRYVGKLFYDNVIPANIGRTTIETEIKNIILDIVDINSIIKIFDDALNKVNLFVNELYETQIKQETYTKQYIESRLHKVIDDFFYYEDSEIYIDLFMEEDVNNHTLIIQLPYKGLNNKQFKSFKSFMNRYMQIFDLDYSIDVGNNFLIYKVFNYE